MKILFLFFSAVLFITEYDGRETASISAPEYHVDFHIVNAGITVNGVIEQVDAQIHFDEKHLGESSIVARAKTRAVRTGIAIRDKHLQRSDYFDAKEYPEIVLRSTSFRKHGKNRFTGMFNLTIKNVTRAISIPFTRIHDGNSVLFHANFSINRLDFQLGEESLILDEKVDIALHAKVADER